MSVLICSTIYGGCGYVGSNRDFSSSDDGDFVFCPACGEDHAFQILKQNINGLTNENNYEKAKELMIGYYKETPRKIFNTALEVSVAGYNEILYENEFYQIVGGRDTTLFVRGEGSRSEPSEIDVSKVEQFISSIR